LAAILESSENDSEPIELPESGNDLFLLFQALYANDPYQLMTKHTVVSITKNAHKYAAGELEAAGLSVARRLAKKCKMSGTTPTIPELLLLSQETQNTALLNAIVTKSMAGFRLAATPTAARAGGVPISATRCCVLHPGEPLPCYYRTAGCVGLTQLDDEGRALLCKLSPKTLVVIIEALLTSPVAARAF
jgi:hypothetical protein